MSRAQGCAGATTSKDKFDGIEFERPQAARRATSRNGRCKVTRPAGAGARTYTSPEATQNHPFRFSYANKEGGLRRLLCFGLYAFQAALPVSALYLSINWSFDSAWSGSETMHSTGHTDTHCEDAK